MLLFKCNHKGVQTGAALVEFAIIVPLLLLLVIGISEFGYAFYHLNILNKSVQDGARYFADPQRARQNNLDLPIDTNNSSNGTNITATRNLIIYGNIAGTGNPLMPNDAANYSPLPTISVVGASNHIQVTAVYNHNLMTRNLLSGLMNLISGGNGSVGPIIPLTATSVFRVESR